MMMYKISIFALLLAALLPTLYNGYRKLSILLQNGPGRLPEMNSFQSYEIKFADKVRSCEDGLLIESKGLAILACDPGREKWNTVMGIFLPGPVPGAELYAYDYGDANAPDSESLRRFEIIGYAPGTNLHTLGIAYHEETSTLFVANARTDGATVEMFTLDLAAFTAVHFRTIRHPLLRGPNAIAILNDHELLVTNDHHFLIKESRFLAKMETYLDLSLGSVVHVDISSLLKDPTGTVEANVVARVSFANGIEVLNNTTIAVASTSKAKVFFYDLTRSDTASTTAPTLTHKSTVKFPFMVDNLQVSKDGSLYVAGHPYFPALEEFSKSRDMCNDYSKLATADPSVQEYCKTANAPSWVSRWTEARGVEHLYVGGEYPSSSTAAFDSERNVGIVTGLYAKGILVWRQ